MDAKEDEPSRKDKTVENEGTTPFDQTGGSGLSP